MALARKLTVGVIVPVHNGAAWLERCLAALAASSRKPERIVVIDDGSTDGSGALAERLGAEVRRTGDRSLGPGRARNVGLNMLDTDVAVFADSDVAFHPDSIDELLRPLEEDSGVTATFGAYDDAPDCRRIAAVYANLRHHVVHMTEAGEAETLWTGVGAVRLPAALAAGGFPIEFRRAGEDIAFGAALRERGGRILIVPSAQGKHMKDWTLRQLWRADILMRALPWAKMIARGQPLGNTLNLRWTQKAQAVLALTLAPLIILGFVWPVLWLAATGAALAWIGLNFRLLRLMARPGLRYLIGGAALHLVYAHYSAAVLALVLGRDRLLRIRRRLAIAKARIARAVSN